MVVGTTIFKMDGNNFYTPEFPRGGLAATFGIDVSHIVGSPNVTVTVEHRNSEDTSFSSAGTFPSTITAAGHYPADLTGLKEIIRLCFAFDAGDASTAGIHFFLQAPSWRPYA